MTRAQRRTRARRIAAKKPLGQYFDPFAAGIALATNPNRGKRNAPRLDHSERELARILEARREDVEVRVTEHRVRDSIGRRIPSQRQRISWEYTARRSDYDGRS